MYLSKRVGRYMSRIVLKQVEKGELIIFPGNGKQLPSIWPTFRDYGNYTRQDMGDYKSLVLVNEGNNFDFKKYFHFFLKQLFIVTSYELSC